MIVIGLMVSTYICSYILHIYTLRSTGSAVFIEMTDIIIIIVIGVMAGIILVTIGIGIGM